jgi:hypothetical protein
MHKSVIIGLLLLTAGLFGVATLNNIFSNVMAQEYDTDQYERYATGGMVPNGYESYGNDNNYYHEADPASYPSYNEDYKSDYRSYPSTDNYDKSDDKSNSITVNNCINVNNINTGSSSSGDLVKEAAGATAGAGIEEEENSGERYSDNGYNNKKGSDFDCIINSNNNVGIGEEGNGVGHKFCILESLEGCFEEHLDQFLLEGIKQAFEAGIEFSTYIYGPDLIQQRVTFSSFEDICLILNTVPTTGGEFNASVYEILLALTELNPNTDEFQDLWMCILDAQPNF